MWFKNICVFRLTEAWSLSAEQLNESLLKMPFKPCMPLQALSQGFVEPIKTPAALLVHQQGCFIMVCMREEKRILTPAMIKNALEKMIAEKETELGRRLSRKEHSECRGDLIIKELPTAKTEAKNVLAYIDTLGGWIVVNSASSANAENVVSLLRNCLGTLPTKSLGASVIKDSASTMAQWLRFKDTEPKAFMLGSECKLFDPEPGGERITFKNADLYATELKNHLNTGDLVASLALLWDKRLSFVLTNKLQIKKLKAEGLLLEECESNYCENEIAMFAADFSMLTLEVKRLINYLIDLFVLKD